MTMIEVCTQQQYGNESLVYTVYVTSESCLQSGLEESESSVQIAWLEGRVWGHENGAGEVLGQGYPLGLGFPTPEPGQRR